MSTHSVGWVLVVAAFVAELPGLAVRAEGFHDNVVVVLDASGSMKDPMPGNRQTKMEVAKSALKTVLQKVPDTTQIGLLVFSARDLRDPWVYPLGPRDDVRLLRAIELLEPHADTPLGRYIKMGADRLLEERGRQFGYGSYRLLVVTDGEAQDQKLVDRYAPEVMARGITLDVIGVAMSRDHTLARKSHSYRRANDPEALQRALAEVMAEVIRERTDVAGADAFELLAPIPVELAAAAVQALGRSGNHPIGTTVQTPAASPARPGPSAGAPAAPTGVTSTALPSPPHVPPPPPGSSSSHRRIKSSAVWVTLFVVLALAAGARRRRRR